MMDFAVGSRIAETRKRAGLSLDELARRARVPAAALVALESGQPADVSTAAVARMARELDVDVSDWVGPPVHTSEPSLFFRQVGVPDFFHTDRGRVVEALQGARSIATVDALLQRTYRRAEFVPVEVGAVPFEQGYELARRVRQVLGLPLDPLGSVSEIIEDAFGVPVFGGSLHAAHLVALTAKERTSNNAVVIVNTNFPGSRRVDLAHELAHVLFDEARQDIDYWLDTDDYERETSRSEQRAKAFAAELLIPRHGLIKNFGQAHDRVQTRNSLDESKDLARRVGAHFRTPPELTTNHLVNNGYIAENLREEVLTSIAFPAVKQPAPRNPMLHRRLAEALGAGLITQMRARELLGLSARDPLPATVSPEP